MSGFISIFRGNTLLTLGCILMTLIALMAVFAPYLGTIDPTALAPTVRAHSGSARSA